MHIDSSRAGQMNPTVFQNQRYSVNLPIFWMFFFLLSMTLLINTFTATPLKKSISHCQAYINFIVFIDLLVNLLTVIFLDICAYHISLKRAFYAEKSDIQYIYLPLKVSSITRDIPVYL